MSALDRERKLLTVSRDAPNGAADAAADVAGRAGEGESLLELSYDYLVLVPGLLDVTVHKLGLKAPVEGLFAPCDKLREEQLDAWVEKMQPGAQACVYGSTVDVLISVQRLLDLGVKGDCISILCPLAKFAPIEDPRACELALFSTQTAGVRIICNSKLTGVEARQHRLRAAVLEDGNTVPCSLLVTHGERGVDPVLFSALNDQSLVFDGRLVVNAGFQTNDPAILAGGDLVKFSRRMQDTRNLELFNLREMGSRLADALLVDLDPDAVAQGRAHPIRVPPLTMPLAQSGILPGGLHFCFMHTSPALYPIGTRHSCASRDVKTETLAPLSYTRIEIDKYGRVSSLCCLSELPIMNAWTLTGFMGMPVTYLNDVVSRCDLGLIEDLLSFLREDWSRALLHDRFQELRRELEDSAQTSEHMAALVSALWAKVNSGDSTAAEVGLSDTALVGDTQLLVQDGLNNFLEQNSNHLQVYLTAARADEMQTNNIWAQTAEKVGTIIGDVPLMDDTC
jgi:hypothetical protein